MIRYINRMNETNNNIIECIGMYSKFNFSHTYNPSNAEQGQSINNNEQVCGSQSQDSVDDLFVIGNRNIIQQQEHDKHKKIRKDKKEKKDKKDKEKKDKHKKEKKSKKDKHKSQYRDQQQNSDSSDEEKSGKKKKKKHKLSKQILIIRSSSQSSQTPQMHHQPPNRSPSPAKYAMPLPISVPLPMPISISSDSSYPQFAVKYKVSPNSLPIDILQFGLPELYQFGLRDGEIPYYKRYSWLRAVIGISTSTRKRKRRMAKLMKELNIVTNQKPVDWVIWDQVSTGRYFEVEGYDRLEGVMPERYDVVDEPKDTTHMEQESSLVIRSSNPPSIKILPQIQFNPAAGSLKKLPTRQQELRKMNKQYNSALISNPTDIPLWIKFLDLQDSINQVMPSSQTHISAMLERKLSILQKSLEKNPMDPQLGLRYLQLLSAGKKQPRAIEQFTQQLLQAHPDDQALWKFYLSHKVANIVSFRHTRLQKELEDVSRYLFDKRIKEIKSGKEVWKIRRCGLVVLQEVLNMHRLEGYAELVTAVCSALLEFNIFCGNQMVVVQRAERVALFKQYWEDYGIYKLGEVICDPINPLANTWEGYQKAPKQAVKTKNPTYIGLELPQSPTDRWLPTHPLHNLSLLQSHPDTFILFQDIELYLQTYGNMENWQLLCNISMANLSMPPIFQLDNLSGGHDVMLIEWIRYTLGGKGRGKCKECPFGAHSLPIWGRFWHPELVDEFLQLGDPQSTQIWKFAYAINIVECLISKFTTLSTTSSNTFATQSLHEYKIFLFGTLYYLHNTVSRPASATGLLQYFRKQQCMSRIQEALCWDPSNITLWVMYIEYERYCGKGDQDCLDCYLQCFQVRKQTDDVLTCLEVVYWLSQFMYRWGINQRWRVVELIRRALLDSDPQPTPTTRIPQIQKLLLGTKLKSLLQQPDPPTKKCLIYYILVQIGQSPTTIIPHLLAINTRFSIGMLIDYGLLGMHHFKDYSILGDNWDIKIARFYVFGVLAEGASNIITLYQRISQIWKKPKPSSHIPTPKLLQWLIFLRMMCPTVAPTQSQPLQQYFTRMARKYLLSPQQPACVEIVCELANNPSLAYQCLNDFPYCRHLYRIAMRSPEFRDRAGKLVVDKEIRVAEGEAL